MTAAARFSAGLLALVLAGPGLPAIVHAQAPIPTPPPPPAEKPEAETAVEEPEAAVEKVDPRGDWDVVYDFGDRKTETTWVISGEDGRYWGSVGTRAGEVAFSSIRLEGNVLTVRTGDDDTRGREIQVKIEGDTFEGLAEMRGGLARVRGTRVGAPAELQETEAAKAEEERRKLERISFEIPFPAEQGGGTASGTADSIDYQREDYVVASGGVELRYRNLKFQAARVSVDLKTKTVTAEGDVIVDEGPRRLTGETLEFDLTDRTGRLSQANAFVDPDIYFSGSEIHKTGEDTYLLLDGVVTSCIKEVPGWSFRTKKARIRIEGFAHITHASMRVKKAPVLYLPYLLYPAKSERSSGFLFPGFGYSQDRGNVLNLAYFQTMGQSFDTTFYFDLYTENFAGFGTEFRYRPSAFTSGNFQGYLIDDPDEDATRWKLEWTHSSDSLPFGMRGAVRYSDFSDFTFFRDFERDFNNFTLRRIQSAGFVTGAWGAHSLNILVDQNETILGGGAVIRQRQLPEIEYRLRSAQVGNLPLYFDLLSSINLFQIERTEALDETYARADLLPQVTVPLSTLPWLSFSLTAGERITWYEDSLVETLDAFGGGSLTRTFPLASAQVIGPSVSRVFEKGLGGFSRFKHIFEPRWGYQFIGEFEDQELVPLFDEVDTLRSSNIFGYALVNRLLAKPKPAEGETEEGQAREILSFEINQAFSLKDDEPLQISRDGTMFTKEGPLGARLRFNPSDDVTFESQVTYSTLFSNLTSASLSGGVSLGRHAVGLTYFTRWDAETGTRFNNQARLFTSFDILRDRLRLDSQLNYDIQNSLLQQQRHQLQFNSQCWGFYLEARENRTLARRIVDYRFALSLKNVGTFLDLTGGSAMGF